MSSAVLAHPELATDCPAQLAGHVVFATNYIPPYALGVYAELAKRVSKLTLLLSTPMEANRKWKPDYGTLDVKVGRTITLARPWRHPTGFCEPNSVHLPWDTVGTLRALKPDMIVAAQLGLRSVLCARYARRTNTPLVLWVNLTEHQEQGRGRIRHWLRRWLVRQADCIAVNSLSGERYLLSLGAQPERIVQVPYVHVPGHLESIELTRPASQLHRLLYVGQLIDRKGLLPFTAALARWAKKHPARRVAFDLAGSGPLEADLRKLELPENLQLNLLGEKSAAELATCYAQSGVLVLPSLSDEWGLVVNEALAAGLPVLGSVYAQAVEELCQQGVTGWKFRTDQVAELDLALDQMLQTSADDLNRMRPACRQSVAALTPAFAAERFLQTLDYSKRMRQLGRKEQS